MSVPISCTDSQTPCIHDGVEQRKADNIHNPYIHSITFASRPKCSITNTVVGFENFKRKKAESCVSSTDSYKFLTEDKAGTQNCSLVPKQGTEKNQTRRKLL